MINPVVSAKYGIEITSFVLENLSLPPEVEEAIDKRSSMAAVGNLNDYVKFQLGKGMESGGGGSGGMATEMAVGLAIAQQMMQQTGGGLFGGTGAASPATGAVTGGGTPVVQPFPELLSVAQVAQTLGGADSDVLAIIESGQLKAKQIGSTHRIKRSTLDAFLAD